MSHKIYIIPEIRKKKYYTRQISLRKIKKNESITQVSHENIKKILLKISYVLSVYYILLRFIKCEK